MAYGFKEQKRHFRFREAPKTEEEAQQRRYDYSVQKLAEWQLRRQRSDYIDPKEVSDYRRALDTYVNSRDYASFAAKMSEQERSNENRLLTSLMDDMNRTQSMGKEEQENARADAAWNAIRKYGNGQWDRDWTSMKTMQNRTKAVEYRNAIEQEEARRTRYPLTEKSSAEELYSLADRLEKEKGEDEQIKKEDAAWLRRQADVKLTAEDIPRLEKEIEEIDYAIKRIDPNATLEEIQENLEKAIDDRTWLKDPTFNPRKGSEYYEQRGKLEQQKRSLEQAKRAAQWNTYASVMNNVNYKERSKYEKPQHLRTVRSGKNNIDETYIAVNGIGQGKGSQYDLITEDERGIFNYLYNTNQKDVAQEYIDWLTPKLNERTTEELQTDAAKFAHQGPVQAGLASAGTALAAPLKAAGYVEDVVNTVRGKDIDINSPAHTFSNVSGAVRGQVAEDIRNATDGFFLNDWTEKIGIDNIGAFAYDTVMSMADNMVNMAIAGGTTGALGLTGASAQHAASAISSVLMGSQVAADSVIEAKQHGDSDMQAVTMGFIRGAIEAATEKWSIDNILNAPDSTLGKIIRNDLLRGFVSEGSEEVASNWLNRVVDAFVYSDEKSLRARVDAYIAQGMSEGKALATALYDDLKEDLPAFLAGGVSGMGMSGIGKGAGLVGDTRQIQDMRQVTGSKIADNGNLNTLLSQADVSGDRKAKRIGEKLQKQATQDRQTERVQRSVERKTGQLYDRLNGVQSRKAQQSIKENFVTGMEKAMETDAAQTVLQEQNLSAHDAAQLLYKAEYKKLSDSEQKVFENIGGKQFIVDMMETEQFKEGIGREAVSAAENADRVRGLLWKDLSPAESEAFGKVSDSMSDDSILSMVDTYRYTKGADAEVFAQNWRLAYQFGKAGIQKDSARIAETDFAISPEQVEMARSLGAYDAAQEAAQYAAAQTEEMETVELGTLEIQDKYGLDDSGVQAIQGYYSDSLGISASEFNKAAQAAYRAGRIGDIRVLEGKSVQSLPDDIRRSIYELGEKYSREEAKERGKKRESTGGKSEKRSGGKVAYQGITREKLTETQRVQADVVEAAIARGAGVNVTFFKSKKNAAGISVGDSGYFDPSTGTIYLDVNAGKSAAQDGIIFTASHELTHWVAEQLPEKFSTFARFLIEEFSGSDVPVDQLIQNKIEEYGGDLSYMDAYEEVVCEACQEFLLRSDAKEKLMQLAQKERNLVQRIGEYIHDLLQRMMDALRDFKAEGDEARYMRQLSEETITNLQQMWSDLVIEAAGTEQTADSGAVKYQKRGINKQNYDYSKPFDQQIDDYKAGKIPKGDTLVIGATPEVFQKIGFNALPMTINTTHVDYALNGTKDQDHFLGEAILKQLSQSVKDPVAVISSQTRSNTSLIALLPVKHMGNTVVLPVYIDGFGFQNGIRIDSNSVTSIYGKNNAVTKLLNDAIREEEHGNIAVYYYNKKIADPLLQSAGLQLSGGLMPRGGYIHSIRESRSPVKPKFENVTYSQQFKRWFGDWQKHPNTASKVVNKDGTPMRMFHGTPAENGGFTVFDSGNAVKKGGLGLNALGIGNYFTSREDAGARYAKNGGRVLECYLDIKKPYEVSGDILTKIENDYGVGLNSNQEITPFLKEQGYDGIIMRDKTGNITLAVAYDPVQIKSATDNIGTFDSNNNDIRYQKRRKTVAEETEAFREIQRAHEALRPGVDMLNELLQYQEESGKGERYTQSSLLTLARILKKDFNLDFKALDIVPVLNRVYEQFVKTKNLTFEQLDAIITEGAWDIGVRKEKKAVRTEYAAGVLRDIKKSKIMLSADQRAEAESISGSYEAYRKFLFGSVTLVNEGISLDTVWQEWAQLYPEVFDKDIPANEQPAALRDAVDTLKNAYEYSEEIDEAEFINMLSRAIYDGYWRVSTLKDVNGKYRKDIYRMRSLHMQMMDSLRKADRGEAMRTEDVEKLYRQMIRDIRTEKNAQLEQYKERVRKSHKKETERRLKTVEKNRVLKIYKYLNDMLLHPTQKKHVPKKLVYATANFLDALNMDTVNAETRVKKYDERIAKTTDDEKVFKMKLTQDRIRAQGERMRSALLEIHMAYEQMKEDTDFSEFSAGYDKDVSDMLKAAAELVPAKSIAQMNSYELRQIGNALSAMQKTIQRSLGGEKYASDKTAYAQGKRMIAETRSIGKAKDGLLDGPINAMARPRTMFERLGNFTKGSAWMEQYEKLNQGQLKQMQIQMEAGQLFADLLAQEDKLRTLSNIRKTVDIGFKDTAGNAVKITRGMMLSVYMHLQNEENARHMLVGGLTVPDMVKYYKKNGREAYTTGKIRVPGAFAGLVRLAHDLDNKQDLFDKATEAGELQRLQDEIAELKKEISPLEEEFKAARVKYLVEIEQQLTDYEQAFIRTAQQFFDVFCKDRLTETTMELYGFKRPMVQHYFPIHTDSDFREAASEAVVRDKSLENAGFMKERVHASNPILLEDITQVIQSQIDSVSKYCGVLPALKSFNQVYSRMETRYKDSVQNAVAETFGVQGKRYIDHLLADLQGARQRDTSFFDRARGNLAYSTLTLNPRVAMAQAASYPTAAAVLGWKAIGKALLAPDGKIARVIYRADMDLIAKHSPLLYYRMKGYSNTEMADIKNMRQGGKNLDRKLRFLTGWIQAVDGATVGRLWYAAEYYVQDHFKKLKAGTDEYYREVANWFNKVVEETQPNYTVMQRPDILRDPNAVTRQLTMFMTQRLQNSNIVYEAVKRATRYREDLKNKKNNVTEADVNQAWMEVYRAVSSQLAAGVTIVAMKMLYDALFLGLRPYKDDDDELTLESIGFGALDLFADTMISNIIGGSEIYGIIKACVGQNRWYGITLSGVGVFEDTIEAAVRLFNGKNDIATLNSFAVAACRLVGLPIDNAEKLIAGMCNIAGNIATFGTPEKMQYDMSFADWIKAAVVSHDLSPLMKKNGQNANILYRAIMDGNQKKVDSVKDTLEKAGNTKKDIDSLIKTGLQKNDARIVQAAQLRLSGDSTGYADLAEEIAADGFDKQLVIDVITSAQNAFSEKAKEAAKAKSEGKDKEYREAVKALTDKGYDKQFVQSYISALSPEEFEAKEEQFDAASGVIQIYNANDIYVNLENGDYSSAQDIADSIYSANLEKETLRGKTEEKARKDARSSLRDSLRAKYKQQYLNGDDAERERILTMLTGLIIDGSLLFKWEDILKWEE